MLDKWTRYKRAVLRAIQACGINPSDLAYAREAVKKRFFQAVDRDDELRVNIGGPRFYKRGWLVLDYRHPTTRHYDFPGMDINFDLLSGEPLPFPDNSVKFFYSSHTIEHLLESCLPRLLADIYRCLKPGGAVRLTTPDFDNLHNAFLREDWHTILNIGGETEYDRFRGAERLYGREQALRLLRGWPTSPNPVKGPYTDEQIAKAFVYDFGRYHEGEYSLVELRAMIRNMSKEEFANKFTVDTPLEWKRHWPQSHTAWFNYEKLSQLLYNAGFLTVYRSRPFESKFEEMRGVSKYWSFDHIRIDTGLYVEAVKS